MERWEKIKYNKKKLSVKQTGLGFVHAGLFTEDDQMSDFGCSCFKDFSEDWSKLCVIMLMYEIYT